MISETHNSLFHPGWIARTDRVLPLFSILGGGIISKTAPNVRKQVQRNQSFRRASTVMFSQSNRDGRDCYEFQKSYESILCVFNLFDRDNMRDPGASTIQFFWAAREIAKSSRAIEGTERMKMQMTFAKCTSVGLDGNTSRKVSRDSRVKSTTQ